MDLDSDVEAFFKKSQPVLPRKTVLDPDNFSRVSSDGRERLVWFVHPFKKVLVRSLKSDGQDVASPRWETIIVDYGVDEGNDASAKLRRFGTGTAGIQQLVGQGLIEDKWAKDRWLIKFVKKGIFYTPVINKHREPFGLKKYELDAVELTREFWNEIPLERDFRGKGLNITSARPQPTRREVPEVAQERAQEDVIIEPKLGQRKLLL